ncbi:PIN domain-containing protein [Methylocystis suflitae]|uniref:PIN domain-containing protein n=1 Tax=Methylocystis suflitae TaxID=2951405 RepID=UPI00210F18A6|nr:PIN domain-containing protein [Methylocystis suflitae]MCQ4189486.1 PIN domain-containing protein [Methylocystis suflitae]
MSVYLDASAIVPLILRDAHTMNMEQWLANAREGLVVSDFAALEVAAVISRQIRMARMSEQQASLALIPTALELAKHVVKRTQHR